jgi:hypothetical protein
LWTRTEWLWLVDNGGGTYNLHKYTAGSWSSVNTGPNGSEGAAIAVNPANPKHIVVALHSGDLIYSTDRGTTWSQPNVRKMARSAGDIPWLANTNESYMSAGNIVFDPAQSQMLYFAEGIGIWYTMNPFTNEPTWISQSAAIEQLVSIWIVSPPGGDPIFTAMDRPVWRVTSPAQPYPSHYGINENRGRVGSRRGAGFE